MQSNLNVVIGVFNSKSGKDTKEKSHCLVFGILLILEFASCLHLWPFGKWGTRGSKVPALSNQPCKAGETFCSIFNNHLTNQTISLKIINLRYQSSDP